LNGCLDFKEGFFESIYKQETTGQQEDIDEHFPSKKNEKVSLN